MIFGAVDRFWSHVDKSAPNGCWQWTGCKTTTGYAQIRINGKRVLVHRFSFELTNGTIPDGLVIDHLCRNRSCVNPLHLEAVSQQVNILRGEGLAAQNHFKTCCPHGHPLVGENIYLDRGKRSCRTCRNARSKETMRRIRKAVAA